MARQYLLGLLALALGSVVLSQEVGTTTTYFTANGVTHVTVYDASGKVISDTTGPASAANSVDGSSTDATAGNSAPASASISTSDGGLMTRDTQAPQAPQPQVPQATPAPQVPQPQTPQATPAQQAPQPQPQQPAPTSASVSPKPSPSLTPMAPTSATPKPAPSTASPKPSTAPSPSTPQHSPSSATPQPSSEVPFLRPSAQPPAQSPSSTPAPGQSESTPSDVPAASTGAPVPSTHNTTVTDAEKAAPVAPTTLDPASSSGQDTSSLANDETISGSISDTAKPLSETDGNLGHGNTNSKGGASWGAVVVVAGVICALVGLAGFVVVNRRRQHLEDEKSDDLGTPMDQQFTIGHNPQPPAQAMSPVRRASITHGKAMPTPVDASAAMMMRQNRGSMRMGSAKGSILQTARESIASSMSRPSSDSSFISSASVAPPPPQPYSFEALASASSGPKEDSVASSFQQTNSFVMATSAKGHSASVVSSNLEYEFSDDSSFQPVANAPRGTGTIKSRTNSVASNPMATSVSSTYTINIVDNKVAGSAPKSSYDFENDVLSDDEDFLNDSDSSSNGDSFTQAFFEQREDSYSDNGDRGSYASSTIRSSHDSFFSRASSEFSERKTNDSLV